MLGKNLTDQLSAKLLRRIRHPQVENKDPEPSPPVAAKLSAPILDTLE